MTTKLWIPRSDPAPTLHSPHSAARGGRDACADACSACLLSGRMDLSLAPSRCARFLFCGPEFWINGVEQWCARLARRRVWGGPNVPARCNDASGGSRGQSRRFERSQKCSQSAPPLRPSRGPPLHPTPRLPAPTQPCIDLVCASFPQR
eukprot:gene17903-biopygen11425